MTKILGRKSTVGCVVDGFELLGWSFGVEEKRDPQTPTIITFSSDENKAQSTLWESADRSPGSIEKSASRQELEIFPLRGIYSTKKTRKADVHEKGDAPPYLYFFSDWALNPEINTDKKVKCRLNID